MHAACNLGYLYFAVMDSLSLSLESCCTIFECSNVYYMFPQFSGSIFQHEGEEAVAEVPRLPSVQVIEHDL